MKTSLAGHVLTFKDQNVNFKILRRARAFNPVNRKCMLCTNEKYFILFNPAGATLNSRFEFLMHAGIKPINKFLFKNQSNLVFFLAMNSYYNYVYLTELEFFSTKHILTTDI